MKRHNKTKLDNLNKIYRLYNFINISKYYIGVIFSLPLQLSHNQ